MADSIFKGGRGQKAPYISTHVRIPDVIKPSIVKFANTYRMIIEKGDQQGAYVFSKYLETIAEGLMIINGVLRNAYRVVAYEDFKQADTKYREARAIADINYEELQALRCKVSAAKILLTDSLALKPNAGGAIKTEIKKALQSLH